MKKSTLALSVAAALGALAFAGNALAIGELKNAVVDIPTTMRLNTDGIGHQLVIPYFSVQAGNVTLFNITNTDKLNAKIVKVRFRAAANSDDIFDFQLLLSPEDVWTAAISQDAATGVATLRTTDKTCTIPSSVSASTGALFITGRVDPTPAKGNSVNETREGYVEVINMADIPPNAAALSLFTTVKHVNGVAPCSGTVLNAALFNDYANFAAATAAGLYQLASPTGGLTGDWVILNQTQTAAWSGSATALQVVNAALAPSVGTLAFWPQKNGTPLLASSPTELFERRATTDPLFVTGVVPIQNFDLPDLSTSYTSVDNATAVGVVGNSAGPAVSRADNTTALLAVKSISNQFATGSGISAVTDFLFSQPTRRYSVAVNYTATATTGAGSTLTTGTTAAAVFRGNGNANGVGSAYYTSANVVLAARQACLNSIGSPRILDREENPATPGGFVISPGTFTTFALCGEAAVASVNGGGTVLGSALNASVVRNDITFGTGFDLGWTTFDTSNGGNALPILGAAFSRVANGSVNYGFTFPHKVTR